LILIIFRLGSSEKLRFDTSYKFTDNKVSSYNDGYFNTDNLLSFC